MVLGGYLVRNRYILSRLKREGGGLELKRKREREKELMDTDSSVVIDREKGWGKIEKGIEGTSSDGRDGWRLDLGGEHTMQ